MSHTMFLWDPKELREHVDNWVVSLDDGVDASHQLLRQMESELPLRAEPWRNYTLLGWRHEFDCLERQLKSLVLNNSGVALLKCGTQVTSDQARLIQLILGCRFGANITITAERDDRPLFAICASEDSTAGGKYTGNGLKTNQIGFHTDGSGSIDREVELLSMLCVRPAEFGGESRVANAQIAYELLCERDREILHRPFPRENPNYRDLSASQMKSVPVFQFRSRSQPYLHFCYHPARIREGIQKAWGNIPVEAEAAFRSVEKALELSSFEFKLCANDILFLNNRVLAHDRRPFSDDKRSPRWLERFWAGTLHQPVRV